MITPKGEHLAQTWAAFIQRWKPQNPSDDAFDFEAELDILLHAAFVSAQESFICQLSTFYDTAMANNIKAEKK